MSNVERLMQELLRQAREKLGMVEHLTRSELSAIGAEGEARDIVLRALWRAKEQVQGDGRPPAITTPEEQAVLDAMGDFLVEELRASIRAAIGDPRPECKRALAVCSAELRRRGLEP